MQMLNKRIAKIEAARNALPIVTEADYNAAQRRREARYLVASWQAQLSAERALEADMQPPKIVQAIALLGNDPMELRQSDELVMRIWQCMEEGRAYDPVQYEREQAELLQRTREEITEYTQTALAILARSRIDNEQAMHNIQAIEVDESLLPNTQSTDAFPSELRESEGNVPKPQFDALTVYLNEQRQLRRMCRPVI